MLLAADKFKKIARLLDLDKPLIIFDIETTGLVISRDKIIQLAYAKIQENGRIKKDIIMFDPEIPITPEAVQVHGIRSRDVKGMPKFRDKCNELWDLFNNCYYGGHNVLSFDLPILRREFIRCGVDFEYSSASVIDTRVIFQTMVPRSLGATYEYYLKKRFKLPHNAEIDLEASSEILLKQLEKYGEARDRDFLKVVHENFGEEIYVDNARKFYWKDGEAYFCFSKYMDKPLAQVARDDPKFLNWILNSDFSDETKTIVKKALGGDFVKKRRYDDK